MEIFKRLWLAKSHQLLQIIIGFQIEMHTRIILAHSHGIRLGFLRALYSSGRMKIALYSSGRMKITLYSMKVTQIA